MQFTLTIRFKTKYIPSRDKGFTFNAIYLNQDLSISVRKRKILRYCINRLPISLPSDLYKPYIFTPPPVIDS